MRKSVAGIVAAIAVAAALSAAAKVLARPTSIGKPAPQFTVTTLDRRKLHLEDFRGKVVVINYWATWCVPCRTEMPLLDAMKRQWEKQGFEVIAVTTEDSVPASRLHGVQDALHFPIATRISGSFYGMVRAVPTNYVIDRSGVLRYAKAGAFDMETANDVIIPLLRERMPGELAEPHASAGAATSSR